MPWSACRVEIQGPVQAVRGGGAAAAAYRPVRPVRDDTCLPDLNAQHELLDVDVAATESSGAPTRTQELRPSPPRGVG